MGLLAFVPTQFPGVGNQALAHDYSTGGQLAAFLLAFAAWLAVLAIIDLAMRSLPYANWLPMSCSSAASRPCALFGMRPRPIPTSARAVRQEPVRAKEHTP